MTSTWQSAPNLYTIVLPPDNKTYYPLSDTFPNLLLGFSLLNIHLAASLLWNLSVYINFSYPDSQRDFFSIRGNKLFLDYSSFIYFLDLLNTLDRLLVFIFNSHKWVDFMLGHCKYPLTSTAVILTVRPPASLTSRKNEI